MASIDLDLTDVLTDSCDVWENATTVDDYGQTTAVASVNVASSRSCRLLPLQSKHMGESKAGQRGAKGLYTLFIMPLPARDITERMWVVISAVRYNIMSAVPPVIDGAPWELLLERIKP